MVSIADILAEHKHREGPLLPILHDVQKAFGHVSEDAMREIAQTLNLTRAEVYGVVSFYHDFRKEAEARPVLKLCRAEACKARGVEALVPIADNQSRIKVEAI
jgi:formate dehydrogenase subunit gamma